MNDEGRTTTVFIVARSIIAQAGLESVLSDDENIIVTGSAAEISAASSFFSIGIAPDVVLINVERNKDYDKLLEFLSETDEPDETNFPFVVALLAPELQTSANIKNALENNLRGALPHDATSNELSAAIKAAANNMTILPPEFMEIFLSSDETEIINSTSANQSENEFVERLTTREREVLELLVEGESNKRIANLLNISEHTVKFHVASVFGKLDANTRTEAVTIAIRRGLIFL